MDRSSSQKDEFPFSAETYSPLQYPLPESWNKHCIPLVMNKFSFDMVGSIYSIIPRAISKAEEGSAFYQAFSAVGCAYVANVSWSLQAISNRAMAYGTALSAVNLALRDPQQCKSDSTLLSVWLLGMYEVRYCIRSDISSVGFTDAHAPIKLLLAPRNSASSVVMSSAWKIHSQGLTELIRLRGPEHFATKDARNLFWIILNTLQIRALMTVAIRRMGTPKITQRHSTGTGSTVMHRRDHESFV
ncbi:hypothetical protein B7463_g8634, partial [Scytalidium lignicola]